VPLFEGEFAGVVDRHADAATLADFGGSIWSMTACGSMFCASSRSDVVAQKTNRTIAVVIGFILPHLECICLSVLERPAANRTYECILKAVVLKAVWGTMRSVKRTHKGPLRDVLATNMRRLRAGRGLSQEALAHESGINRTYLSAVERSERNISIDNIARIAKGLRVEAWTLLKD
jgi:DNA-binding XRE family transcriptional regulator